MEWVYLSFIIAALTFIVLSFILNKCRQRFIAGLFELISFAFLLCYSTQFSTLLLDITHLNVYKSMGVLFFVFCIVLFIYKLITLIKYKK